MTRTSLQQMCATASTIAKGEGVTYRDAVREIRDAADAHLQWLDQTGRTEAGRLERW